MSLSGKDLQWLVVWNEVLHERLPEDVRNYITGNFIIPFVIAQREGERIEPFYSTKNFIDRCRFSLDMLDHPELDTDAFDYIGANNLLLDDALILDKRIGDGRHEKYVILLESLLDVECNLLDMKRLIMRGLDWDSFVAFRKCSDQDYTYNIPRIYPNVGAYLERLVIQIKIDTVFGERIQRYLGNHSIHFIVIALNCLSENAVASSICYIPKDDVCHRYKVRCNDSDKEKVLALYDKYRHQLEKYLVLVFSQ